MAGKTENLTPFTSDNAKEMQRKEKLTVPILPFSEIDKIGAGMYKGENITVEERHKKGVAELKGKR